MKRPETTKTKTETAAARRPHNGAAAFVIEHAIEEEVPPELAMRGPDVPVKTFLFEAERICRAARPHREVLVALLLDPMLVDTLPARIEALRDAEHRWNEARLRRNKPPASLRIRIVRHLKREVIAGGRFLLRHDRDAQAELTDIVAGSGLADLVDDAKRLASFARRHARALEGAKLPDGLSPREAADRLEALARDITEDAARDRNDTTAAEALAWRNRCFWLTATPVRELRAAATYAFRNAPELLAPFRADYVGGKKRRSRSKKRARPVEAPVPIP